MPRISAEARAASYHLAGGTAPAPPAHLDTKSKKLWREITHSRPPDFFRPGATHLLEAFVETIVMRRFYQEMWERHRDNSDYLKAVVMLNNSLSQLATKLRIANTSVYGKKDGILTEKGEPDLEGTGKWLRANVIEGPGRDRSLLFGGGGTTRF